MFLQVAVTDDRDPLVTPGLFLVRQKGAPRGWVHAEYGEVIRAHNVGGSAAGVSFFAQADDGSAVREETGEDGVLLAEIAVERIGKGAKILRVFFVLGEELDDLVRLLISRRRKEHLVDEREDGGVHPDPEREDGDGGEGEPRGFPELAKGEAEVVDHGRFFVRRLFMAERNDGIDLHGPAGRDHAGNERNNEKKDRERREGQGIGRRDAVKQSGKDAGSGER